MKVFDDIKFCCTLYIDRVKQTLEPAGGYRPPLSESQGPFPPS